MPRSPALRPPNLFYPIDLIIEAETQAAHWEKYGSDKEDPEVGVRNNEAIVSTSRWRFTSVGASSDARQPAVTLKIASTPSKVIAPSKAHVSFKTLVSSKAVSTKASVPSKAPILSKTQDPIPTTYEPLSGCFIVFVKKQNRVLPPFTSNCLFLRMPVLRIFIRSSSQQDTICYFLLKLLMLFLL